MGNISGNHDKCRFISLAGGAVRWDENDKAAGWEREIGVTADGDAAKEEQAYKAAMLLEVINLRRCIHHHHQKSDQRHHYAHRQHFYGRCGL